MNRSRSAGIRKLDLFMNPLRFIVDAFVNTFGITRPTPSQEKVAGKVILGMLIFVLAGLAIAFLLARSAMTH